MVSLSSILLNVFIPDAATVPNITIPTPPKTGCGISVIKAEILGRNPSITNIKPAITATCLLATFVNEITPTFWLNEVLGNDPSTPPIILPIPSAKTPAPTCSSFIPIFELSPTAFKHPTVSIVVTKYAGKNANTAFKSNFTPYSNILGIDTQLASLIDVKSTIPNGIQIIYPIIIPISIEALLIIPFP